MKMNKHSNYIQILKSLFSWLISVRGQGKQSSSLLKGVRLMTQRMVIQRWHGLDYAPTLLPSQLHKLELKLEFNWCTLKSAANDPDK